MIAASLVLKLLGTLLQAQALRVLLKMANYANVLLLIVYTFSACSAYIVDNNPYRHRVTLDRQGKYQLEWLVDWDSKRITFNVTVATTGYVGFGIARKGKMAGADLVIGGVRKDGSPYFSDRYAIGNQLPQEDPSQDWLLIEAREIRGVETFLSFSRAFDTCDEDHDLPITQYDLTSVIWAYSEADDEIQYHFQNRGSYDVYLLDPDLTPRGIERVSRGSPVSPNVDVFRMTRNVRLRPQDTMYWCSFHKLPMTRKHHLIGFNTVFPSDQDRSHVHHLLLHRCRAPPGTTASEFFEGPARSGGSECYVLDQPNSLPVPYCRETLHVWGVGGRSIFFPEHAGIPLRENERDEYLMLQVHYDNPSNTTNRTVTVSLDLYHTPDLRENDVGVLQLGDMQPGSTTILVPPSETNHVIMGHCSPGCTERVLGPVGGANVFAVFLHTHLSGRGVRAMHFRNGRELPWIQADDNYNFNYQQFRVLRQEVKIEPGDLLINRCVYDNTAFNGSVVTGGFSTREEMCTAFMYYYTRNPGYALCRGEILTEKYWNFLGIRNVTWNQSIRQTQVTNPPQFAGMTMNEYANTEIPWNLQSRRELQKMQIFEPQISHCPRFFWQDPQYQLEQQLRDQLPRTGRLPGSDGRAYTSVDNNFSFESVYPRNIQRWKPEPQCSRRLASGIDENSVW